MARIHFKVGVYSYRAVQFEQILSLACSFTSHDAPYDIRLATKTSVGHPLVASFGLTPKCLSLSQIVLFRLKYTILYRVTAELCEPVKY